MENNQVNSDTGVNTAMIGAMVVPTKVVKAVPKDVTDAMKEVT